MIILSVDGVLIYWVHEFLFIDIVHGRKISRNNFELSWFCPYYSCIPKGIIGYFIFKSHFQSFYHFLSLSFISSLFEVKVYLTQTNNVYSFLIKRLKNLLSRHIKSTSHDFSNIFLEMFAPAAEKEYTWL